jgi:hypothetical protein
MKVRVFYTGTGNSLGSLHYHPDGMPYIELNRGYYPTSDSAFFMAGEEKETLIHEIQHLLQDQEGFARGSNIAESIERPAEEKKKFDALKAKHDVLKNKPWGQRTTLENNRLQQLEINIRSFADRVKTEANSRYMRTAGEEEARRVSARADMTAEERMGTPYERTDLAQGEERIVRTGGGVAEARNKTPEIGDSMTSGEFRDYISSLPLKDSFGKLDYNDAREISGAGDRWTLKAVDLETLQPVDARPDTKFPIIMHESGDVLDGRRRLNAAQNRGDKAILA